MQPDIDLDQYASGLHKLRSILAAGHEEDDAAAAPGGQQTQVVQQQDTQHSSDMDIHVKQVNTTTVNDGQTNLGTVGTQIYYTSLVRTESQERI